MSEDFNNLFREFNIPERGENLRQKELQSRYETWNDEEKAELMGLNVFPDNPRGAELRKKEALGLISGEEKEELRRLYKLKTRQEKNTPAVQKLWERVEANDPSVEQVDMGNGKSIEVTPTDDEKAIWTFGLDGCYGSVVFTEHEDGTRDCVLTHYPPTELSVNMGKLGDLINTSERMKTAKTKKVVLVLPGEWIQNPDTKKYEMKTKNQQAVDALTLAIQAELGTDIEIKLEPYSEMINAGEKDQGTLVVYVPPAGKGDVRYQTWYNAGKLTEKSESKE
ncbi:MAG: hypothetical protein GYA35_00375 [Thermoanaerobaculaceae bacterium]|nr:hypothetical protein [Thermoanaerobaculaceae bacterium]